MKTRREILNQRYPLSLLGIRKGDLNWNLRPRLVEISKHDRQNTLGASRLNQKEEMKR